MVGERKHEMGGGGVCSNGCDIRNRALLNNSSEGGVWRQRHSWCAWYARLSVLLLLSWGWLGLVTRSAEADEGFRRWLEGLWPEARAMGVSRATFEAAFRGVTPDLSLPDLVLPGADKKKRKPKGQAEFVKPPKNYLIESYIAKLARQGREKARKWSDVLGRIERRFGVDRSIVVAIWGRETAFGRYRLPHNVFRALATQGYLGRRKRFFRKQLLLALKILEEGHISRAGMRSSWAGAMGITQFLPSDFYDYAVDFDGDGRKDIWRSIPDALASTANSLVVNGWVPRQTWGYEVRKPGNLDCTLEGIPNARPIRDWLRLGFRRTRGRTFRKERLNERAYLLLPEGSHGPAFLMLKNFRVIKTYNFADLYALFVGHLADRIAGGAPFETPWATSSQMKRSDVAELQRHLNRLGFNAGKVDGRVGPATRNAIGAYEKAHGLPLNCYPSQAVLRHIRRTVRHLAAN